MTPDDILSRDLGFVDVPPLEDLLDFIVPYDESGLSPLGPIDLLSLELAGLSEEELRPLRALSGPGGVKNQETLRELFSELQEVRVLMRDETTRSDQTTWNKLSTVLDRYSSSLLVFGRDRDHYGADLASRAVRPTAFYNKAWKTEHFDGDTWRKIEESLTRLSYGMYNMYTGNVVTGDEHNEAAGITLEKILRGNDVAPLLRCWSDDDDDALRVHVVGNDDGPALVPDRFAETGSTNSLKEMFPFFHYWSEKAEKFVNGEKTVNITMNIQKFFEDINVTMEEVTDTAELERNFVSLLNRSLEIALGSADF